MSDIQVWQVQKEGDNFLRTRIVCDTIAFCCVNVLVLCAPDTTWPCAQQLQTRSADEVRFLFCLVCYVLHVL